jgi:hypothetical protein
MDYLLAFDDFSDPPGYLTRCEQAYKDGNLRAIYYALSTCRKKNIAVPEWLVEAVSEITWLQTFGQKGRGRSGNYFAKLKQDNIHELRWAIVKHLRGTGLTWPRAYAAAASELRGSAAQGSEDAMCSSYKKFNRSAYILYHKNTSRPEFLVEIARGFYEHRSHILAELPKNCTDELRAAVADHRALVGRPSARSRR